MPALLINESTVPWRRYVLGEAAALTVWLWPRRHFTGSRWFAFQLPSDDANFSALGQLPHVFFLPCQLHGLRCALFSVGTEALWSSTQPTVTVPPSRSLCKLGRFSSRYGKLKWVIWHCQCWIANLLLLRVLQNLQNQREVSWYCLDVCLPDLGQLSSSTLSCFIIEVRVNRLFLAIVYL